MGLSGEGQSFDGNGQLTRFTTGGGATPINFGKQQGTGSFQYGNAYEPGGSRPAYPGKLPAFKSDVPCYKNPLPDVNSAQVKPSVASAPLKQGRGHPRSGGPNPLDGTLEKPLPGVDTKQKQVVPGPGSGGGSVLGDLVGLLNPFGRLR